MLRNPLLSGRAAWLEQYRLGLRIVEQGRVRSVGDGIVWIEGLPSAAMEEVLWLEDGSRALVFHLAKERLGAILLTQTTRLTAGTIVHLSGRRLSLPVGDQLMGRVVDPLGDPLDGRPPSDSPSRRELFASSPPIVARDFVHRPLYTGSKVVDTLIPVAKGQRQLIIGDNGIGKRAFALDTIINQREKNVRCVYVSIGQKRSSIVNTIDTLQTYGAMDYTAVVAAEATTLPGLKYTAPFAGCALAEAWMWKGHDTLVVYDDLTTHAQTYRELSLLLRRPPGREAYPGDIFFLHSRLLERSTCLAPSLGGGSMTALPVVETTQGEIAAYIPTNLISITDGQIYFDTRLFAGGMIPAIDVTKSVSRIGGKGQHPRIKEQAGRMKLDFLQFLELEVFTRFGAKLEATMEAKIRRGRILREILKQERLSPLPIEFQLAWLTGFNRGLFDDVPPEKIGPVLSRIASRLSTSRLTLDQRDEQWAEAVTSWLKEVAT
ncbi:MAG: ATP synthase alpha chain [Nitrospira sp.]|jgi:F-type H+-transporting ATPase subunit alpha|nr:MAG: ATP synthase alpha chain [Nitrospira sp.]